MRSRPAPSGAPPVAGPPEWDAFVAGVDEVGQTFAEIEGRLAGRMKLVQYATVLADRPPATWGAALAKLPADKAPLAQQIAGRAAGDREVARRLRVALEQYRVAGAAVKQLQIVVEAGQPRSVAERTHMVDLPGLDRGQAAVATAGRLDQHFAKDPLLARMFPPAPGARQPAQEEVPTPARGRASTSLLEMLQKATAPTAEAPQDLTADLRAWWAELEGEDRTSDMQAWWGELER